MFNPVGAVIQGIITIYNTVAFFIERAQQIAALAEAVFDSISNIAAGNIGAAINYVERTMARTLPVIIGFLARLIGLGNVSGQIRSIIERIQGVVDRAIDRVVNFIVQRVKGLLARDAEAAREVESSGLPRSDDRWSVAVTAVRSELHRMEEEGLGERELNTAIPRWREQHGFETLTVEAKEDEWIIEGSMSPTEIIEKAPRPGSRQRPFELTWPKPPSSSYPILYFGGLINKPRTQSTLKGMYTRGVIDETGNPIKAYAPHRGGTLPDGPTIGISAEYRIAKGTIVGPLSVASTPGGSKLNRPLSRYGFAPGFEEMDADHVREIQFGGEDEIENLWPLDASTNRAAGSTLARTKVKYPNGRKEIGINELKDYSSRRYYFKITDFLY